MYNAVLLLHGWLRWLVLIAAIAVIVRSALNMSGGTRWTTADARGLRMFIIALDVQTLLGFLLYAVLSPFVRLAMSDAAAAMRDGDLRFWLVEHLAGMLVAVALAHVGSVRVRRANDDGSKQRTAALFVGLALVAILLSIPWPGMPSARPLFRF
jgi:hypothetical protein